MSSVFLRIGGEEKEDANEACRSSSRVVTLSLTRIHTELGDPAEFR